MPYVQVICRLEGDMLGCAACIWSSMYCPLASLYGDWQLSVSALMEADCTQPAKRLFQTLTSSLFSSVAGTVGRVLVLPLECTTLSCPVANYLLLVV